MRIIKQWNEGALAQDRGKLFFLGLDEPVLLAEGIPEAYDGNVEAAARCSEDLGRFLWALVRLRVAKCLTPVGLILTHALNTPHRGDRE